jgi:hypothetical protein
VTGTPTREIGRCVYCGQSIFSGEAHVCDPPESLGVREPRRPIRPTLNTGVANDLPETWTNWSEEDRETVWGTWR